jgi:membrane protease YdiL (CAAX protease family)
MHWDFALILAVLGIAVPLLGRRRVGFLLALPDTTKSDRLSLYASTIVFQWCFALLIFWRISRHAIRPEQLGSSLEVRPSTVTIMVILSVEIFAIQLLGLHRLSSDRDALRSETAQVALKVFPRDGMERIAFVALVSTVAICEEFIYRGFAQYVFQDWSHSLFVGILGSAMLFSIAHLYQGRRGLASTFGAGVIFAGVRAWSGTLLPTIVAHFVADLMIGLLAPRRIREALARGSNAGSSQAAGRVA